MKVSDIENVRDLVEFVHTRSAYVAQTSLYGYLKTRMGRQYVEIFTDSRFEISLNESKWKIYSACLSDLSVYVAARIDRESRLPHDEAEELANYCQKESVRKTFAGEFALEIQEDILSEFRNRSGNTIWANAAIGDNAFTHSPLALARTSPVTDEFKMLDQDIVMNSVRFRWNNIRDDFNRRANFSSIQSDWKLRSADQSTRSR